MDLLLKELLSTLSVSGCEKNMGELVIKRITPFVDKFYTDQMGNIIARKAGKGSRVMLLAGLDQSGIVATYISDDGKVRFAPMGTIDIKAFVGNKIIFENGITGIVCCSEEIKDITFEKCFIDIGAKSKEQASESIPLGTVGAVNNEPFEKEEFIFGSGISSKIGIFVLLDVIKNIEHAKDDLYFVFSVQKRVGNRGIPSAVFSAEPEYALNIDYAPESAQIKCGSGVAIRVVEGGSVCHKFMNNTLQALSKRAELPLQFEVNTKLTTLPISGSREGVVSGTLAIPVKYENTPYEMVDTKDIKDASRLLSFMLEKGIKPID